MHAVIFDIDGTLLQSNDIDGKLFVSSVQRVLGKVRIRESWSDYVHVTDRGILDGIMHDNALPVDSRIVEAIQKDFFESLKWYIEEKGPFIEIPGARRFVKDIHAAFNVAFAYATGSWAESAVLKLNSAGFPVNGVPLSSSDDSDDRCMIMLNALKQLGQEFETITYYGDGVWDRSAAVKLGWDFVPVGAELGGIKQYWLYGAQPVFKLI